MYMKAFGVMFYGHDELRVKFQAREYKNDRVCVCVCVFIYFYMYLNIVHKGKILFPSPFAPQHQVITI